MIRYLIILLSSLFALPSFAWQWHDLWQTANQQGQQLMKENHFSEAQNIFKREDWAATAAYRAQDYASAAKLYKNLNTEQGYYNAGNALAHLQHYEEAIKAYDKALALNAQNQDALYNRKLIKQLLQKQQKQQKQKPEQQQQEQQKSKQQQQEQSKSEQQQQEQQKAEQQQQEQSKSEQQQEQQKAQQQQQEQQKSEQQQQEQQKAEQQQEQQKAQQQQQEQQKSEQQQQKQQKAQQQQQEQKQQKAEQQQQEQKPQKQPPPATAKDGEIEREKQQAKEQWLKLIPDDPGGLMREKFLRDHLRRQREVDHE